MGAILKITFLAPAQVDDTLAFKYYWQFPDTEFPANVIQNFVTSRTLPGYCTIGADAVSQAQNYVDAFTADYTGSGQLIISRQVNVVTITCLNGSEIFDAALNVGADFAALEIVDSESDNMIHEIIFTPKQYAAPSGLERNYLVTEEGELILTEDNKKIRL